MRKRVRVLMNFAKLTDGALIALAIAVGTTGYSDWSDPVAHMSM